MSTLKWFSLNVPADESRTDPKFLTYSGNLNVRGDVNVVGNLVRNGKIIGESGKDSLPIGSIIKFPEEFELPEGYIRADGSSVQRFGEFELLWEVVGLSFEDPPGQPTSETTFRIPDVPGHIIKYKIVNDVALAVDAWRYNAGGFTHTLSRVGIGLTNPNSLYTLDVNGSINFTGELLKDGEPVGVGGGSGGSGWVSGLNVLYTPDVQRVRNDGDDDDDDDSVVQILAPTKVGIGVSNPQTALHVNDLSSSININRGLRLGDGSSYTIINQTIQDKHACYIQSVRTQNNISAFNSDILLNPLGGNVGVGITNPGYKLDVVGDINLTGSLRVNGVTVLSSSESLRPTWVSLGNDLFYTGGNVGVGTNNVTDRLTVDGNLRLVNNSSAIRIGSKDALTRTTLGEDVVNSSLRSLGHLNNLSVQGNVGVGTSNPFFKMDVFGDINVRGRILQNGAAFTGSGSWGEGDSVVFTNNTNVGIGTSTPDADFVLFSSSARFSPTSGMKIGNDVAFGMFNLLTENEPTVVVQGATQETTDIAISLNPLGGNVGVGVSQPTSKLHVSGGARVDGMPGAVWKPLLVSLTDKVEMEDGSGETFTITVVDKDETHPFFGIGSTQAFVFDAEQPIQLERGRTYRFLQEDPSNMDNPIYISTTAEGASFEQSAFDPEGHIYFGTPGQPGAYLDYTVPIDAPDELFFASKESDFMGRAFVVSGDGIGGDPITSVFTITVDDKDVEHPFFGVGSSRAFVFDVEHPIQLERGRTYRFLQEDSSNDTHPIYISTTAEGRGFPASAFAPDNHIYFGTPGQPGAYLDYTVPLNAPNELFFACQDHEFMGRAFVVFGDGVFPGFNTSGIQLQPLTDSGILFVRFILGEILIGTEDGKIYCSQTGVEFTPYDIPEGFLAKDITRFDNLYFVCGTSEGNGPKLYRSTDKNVWIPMLEIPNELRAFASDSERVIVVGSDDFVAYYPFTEPEPEREPLTWEVINNNDTSYSFSGFSSGENVSIEVEQGTILQFNVDSLGQPFWIKFVQSSGDSFDVNEGVTNNGIEQGMLTWDTANAEPGVYFYNSENIESMTGTITITPIEAPLPEIQIWEVSNDNDVAYSFSGQTTGNNVTIEVERGVNLVFNINTPGQPFWIKDSPTPGIEGGVTVGLVQNGLEVGTINWNTAEVEAGTYYYISENGGTMTGLIIITEPVEVFPQWKSLEIPGNWNTATYFSGRYYIAGTSGSFARSTTGLNWQSLNIVSSVNFSSIVGSEDTLVTVGQNGFIYTYDAELNTLNQASSGVSSNLVALVWNPELQLFVAFSATGVVVSSADGRQWTTTTTIESVTGLTTAIWISELSRYIIGGADGLLLVSDNVTPIFEIDGSNVIVSGKLGVNQSNPSETLDVDGCVNISQENSYKIGGQTVLSQTSLGPSVVSSSLTNVGILQSLIVAGNTILQGNLTVNGTQTIVNTEVETTSRLEVTNNGTGPAAIINQTGEQPIIDFQDDGSSVMYIADGGNVGLGTTEPSEKLDVVGNALISGNLTVDTDTLVVNSTDNRVGINTDAPTAELDVVGNALISGNLTVDTDTLVVNSTDNRVGINTDAPTAELDVVGNTILQGNLTVDTDTLVVNSTDNRVGINTDAPTAELDVVGQVKFASSPSEGYTLEVDGDINFTGGLFQNGVPFVSGSGEGGGGGDPSDALPVGAFVNYPWSAPIPDGFLKCDGAAVSREEYAQLFEILGTEYGPGDGSTTFNLPTFFDYIVKFRALGGTTTVDYLPIGSVITLSWAIDPYPSGWLKCDGREVSRREYSQLFAAIGIDYGSGDGSTTFELPHFFNQGIKYRTTIEGGLVSEAFWIVNTDSSLYNLTNVGIGTTEPAEKLHVEGNILLAGNLVPAANEQYDLGTSTASFRDLYLSGDTIFLGNTKISTDSNTGEITFRDKDTDALQTVVSESTKNIETVGDNTIIESGNVGIGTTNPDTKLQVVGNMQVGDFNVMQQGGRMRIRSSENDHLVMVHTGERAYRLGIDASRTFRIDDLDDSESNRLSITSAGNVGIGVTNPTRLLHLESNAENMLLIRRQGTGGSSMRLSNDNHQVDLAMGVSGQFQVSAGSENRMTVLSNATHLNVMPGVGTEGIVRLGRSDFDIRFHEIVVRNDQNPTGNYMDFNLHENGGDNRNTRNIMRLRGDGNVGIGTTNPTDSLHVAGNILVDRGVINTINGYGGWPNGTEEDWISYSYTQYGGVPAAAIKLFNNNTSGSLIGGSFSDDRVRIGMTFHTRDNSIVGLTEKMRINSNGNVGIGVTNPTDKLTINENNGGIRVIGGGYLAQNSAYIQLEGGLGDTGFIHGWRMKASRNTSTGGSDARLDFLTVSRPQVENNPSMTLLQTGNVGIGVTNPGSNLQVGSPVGSIYPNNPLGNNQVSIFGPHTEPSITGSNAIGGTLWVNTTSGYAPNRGSSIALGGRGNNFGGGEQHMSYGRISGVQRTDSTQFAGDLVLETSSQGTMFERMRILHNGNVGIGVTNPTEKLVVDNGSNAQAITMQKDGVFNDQNQALLFRAKTSGTPSGSGRVTGGIHRRAQDLRIISSGDNSRLLFYTGTAENTGYDMDVAGNPFSGTYTSSNDIPKMTILQNGNVGIGTTNPTDRLHVFRNSAQLATFYRNAGSTGIITLRNDFNVIDFRVKQPTSTGFGLFLGTSSAGVPPTTMTERLTVLQNGNVGIGTTNPVSRLHVDGQIRLETSEHNENALLVSYRNSQASGTGFATRFGRGTSTAPAAVQNNDVIFGIFSRAHNGTEFAGSNTGAIRILASENQTTTAAGTKIDFRTTPNGSTSPVNSRMVIDHNGNVGVASVSPTQARLVVGNPDTANAYGGSFYLIRDSSIGPSGQFFNNDTYTNSTSIFATGMVWSSTGFLATSDSRIKKDILPITDECALQKLRLIQPAEYKYVDEIQKGSKPVFGFIAQQVAEHFPEAVALQRDFVPDIYHLQPVDLEQHTIEIPGRAKTGKLRLIALTRQVDLEVTALNENIVGFEEGTLTSEDIQDGMVFVMGYEVEDLHTLKKEYLFTINFAATQELDRVVQNQKSEMESQKAEMESQKAEMEDLKQVNDDLMLQNMSLKNRVSELESQLSSLLTALTDKGIL